MVRNCVKRGIREWFRYARSEIAPVRSSSRSDRVVLPWSMWAMMLKFRMREDFIL